jgi:HAD superfamily hydrolase (TIGR01509 family)
VFNALIFDCDGVLVDSEVLAQEVELAALAAIGLDYPRDEFTRRFTGTSAEDMNAAVAEDFHHRFGRPIPAGFFDELGSAIHRAYAQHLQPIEGAVQLAAAWSKPKAVASSSSAPLVELKLRKAGLAEVFYPHVFTADHGRAKPHPDLFLMAASALGTNTARCVVVEDSVNGVTAAKRAGMQVIGFTGGAHCDDAHADTLKQGGADWVFENFAQVADFLLTS